MEELLDFGGDSPKCTLWDDYCPVKETAQGIEVYLTSNIDNPSEYGKVIHSLMKADEGDTATFIINNGGGALDSALMIVDAIKNTKATTVAHLSGTVASAATIIALSCDKLIVSKYLSFMVHNYSLSYGGSGNQVKEFMGFTGKEFVRVFKKIYKGFLTKKEIKAVTEQDKELWFNDKQVRKRWSRMKKLSA